MTGVQTCALPIYTDINNKDLVLDTITINEKEVTCAKFKKGNDNYCLLNVLKEDGSLRKYLYEKTEGTIQLYNDFNICPEIEKENKNIILYILSGIVVLTTSIIIFLFYKIKKRCK